MNDKRGRSYVELAARLVVVVAFAAAAAEPQNELRLAALRHDSGWPAKLTGGYITATRAPAPKPAQSNDDVWEVAVRNHAAALLGAAVGVNPVSGAPGMRSEGRSEHDGVSAMDALKLKIAFIQAWIASAQQLISDEEKALLRDELLEARGKVSLRDALEALRGLAAAAANNSDAYGRKREWRTAEGLAQRLEHELRPEATNLTTHLIPALAGAASNLTATRNATQQRILQLQREVDRWEIVLLRAEAELLNLQLSAFVGDATLGELQLLVGPPSKVRTSEDQSEGGAAIAGLESATPLLTQTASPSIIAVESSRSGTGASAVPYPSLLPSSASPVGFPNQPSATTAATADAAVSRAGLPSLIPLLSPAPEAQQQQKQQPSRAVNGGAGPVNPISAAAAIVPSLPCPDEASCSSQAMAFAAAATVNFQRAAAAALALAAIHSERSVAARGAFLPLRLKRWLQGMRAQTFSRSIAKFDGESVGHPAGVLPMLCFFQVFALRNGCSKKVVTAADATGMRSFGDMLRCALQSWATDSDAPRSVPSAAVCADFLDAMKEPGAQEAKSMYEVRS
jgi:hypothetical protein